MTIPRLDVEILTESALWEAESGSLGVIEDAVHAASAHLPASIGWREIAIVLTDDSTIRSLNRDWRGQDKPTNVLSFPAAPERGADPGAPHMLGDIAIAFETVQREAKAEQKSFAHHLAHLTIHGVLHLAGHDHENDAEAETMEALERTILASLGIADPYADIG